MPSLKPDYRYFLSQALRLEELGQNLQALEPKFQKVAAEVVHLRLYGLLENLISMVPAKLVAGARFLDNSKPSILLRSRSVEDARNLFRKHGRTTPNNQLRWSKASDIKETVKYVILPSDNYVIIIDRYGSLIDEVRRVRNRIAHNNQQSRHNYQTVVRRYYGAYLNHINPGTLLLSPRKTPCLLEQYIRKLKILAKDLVRG